MHFVTSRNPKNTRATVRSRTSRQGRSRTLRVSSGTHYHYAEFLHEYPDIAVLGLHLFFSHRQSCLPKNTSTCFTSSGRCPLLYARSSTHLTPAICIPSHHPLVFLNEVSLRGASEQVVLQRASQHCGDEVNSPNLIRRKLHTRRPNQTQSLLPSCNKRSCCFGASPSLAPSIAHSLEPLRF
ncbi:hypothetical protein EJ06DRAFT_155733 [Trichodelitschia bisporula]|uniref:Uncharacterized protein n=1 Tax=Trichodelitschia bisporula TaxID=703511 RepID=A0A6G1HNT0_9PEZI|nr:hypothetical protein EJ06DRAFT_155733 [Trichodelitschia bisporula]